MTVNQQIQDRIEAFVAELSVLVRKAAIAAVADALGAPSSAAQPRRGAVRRPKPPPSAHSAASASASVVKSGALRLARRKKGAKRDPKEIAKVSAAVQARVRAHPGEGVETIAKHLGVKTSEVTMPIRKLLAAKAITRKGIKRATRYFPK